MRRRQFLKLAGSAAAASPAITAPALAQAAKWPDKPVKIIVPFAAGGGTDLVARPWADKLGQAFGQQFVVENRGGASGMIGAEATAKSAPDGYTFIITSNTVTVNLPLLRKTPYKPHDFEPVARVGDVVCGFVITTQAGPKTFKEMVEFAKKNPSTLSFGSSGPGTGPHLRYEMLRYRTGVDILHVPYRGGADSLTDLLSGSIHMMNEPNTLPHVKAGKLHLLNVNHSARIPDFPDVPTLTEVGYPNSDMPIWFSIWAPKGVPKEITQTINAKVVELSKTDEVREKLHKAGAVPIIQTIPEMQAFWENDTKGMVELIKVAKIKIEP
jgi:tripartite-type tricarboxylate transporter receptor subunit TctC